MQMEVCKGVTPAPQVGRLVLPCKQLREPLAPRPLEGRQWGGEVTTELLAGGKDVMKEEAGEKIKEEKHKELGASQRTKGGAETLGEE